jgi:hypothetical protein
MSEVQATAPVFTVGCNPQSHIAPARAVLRQILDLEMALGEIVINARDYPTLTAHKEAQAEMRAAKANLDKVQEYMAYFTCNWQALDKI